MKAIILSAGQGRRLLPLTRVVPKCCLRPGGLSILEWQIRELTAAGVNEVVVVTGFGHEKVEEIVKRVKGIRARSFYNPFYAFSDNLGTCWVAREIMDGPFVLVNGDTLFEAAVMQRLLLDATRYPITLATDQKVSYDDDDMKIRAKAMQLYRVGKELNPNHVNGESIGMMYFNAPGAKIFVRKVEELMSRGDGLKRWYLSAIDELAQAGVVGISSIHGLSWCEVDDPVDLAYAETVVKTWPYRANVTQQTECAETGLYAFLES